MFFTICLTYMHHICELVLQIRSKSSDACNTSNTKPHTRMYSKQGQKQAFLHTHEKFCSERDTTSLVFISHLCSRTQFVSILHSLNATRIISSCHCGMFSTFLTDTANYCEHALCKLRCSSRSGIVWHDTQSVWFWYTLSNVFRIISCPANLRVIQTYQEALYLFLESHLPLKKCMSHRNLTSTCHEPQEPRFTDRVYFGLLILIPITFDCISGN